MESQRTPVSQSNLVKEVEGLTFSDFKATVTKQCGAGMKTNVYINIIENKVQK